MIVLWNGRFTLNRTNQESSLTLTFRFFKIIGGFVQLAMIITTLILPSIFMAVSITFIPNSIMTFHQLAWYEYQCFFNDIMNIFWYGSLMKRKILNKSEKSRIKLYSFDFEPGYWWLRSASTLYKYSASGVGCITNQGRVVIYILHDDISVLPTYMSILPTCMIWKID